MRMAVFLILGRWPCFFTVSSMSEQKSGSVWTMIRSSGEEKWYEGKNRVRIDQKLVSVGNCKPLR